MNLHDLKNRIPVRDLLEMYGVDINRSGFCKCIAHDDRNPSMKVYDRTNSVHCFSCGADFDEIGIVQRMEGIRFKEAVEKLKRIVGVSDEIDMKIPSVSEKEMERKKLMYEFRKYSKMYRDLKDEFSRTGNSEIGAKLGILSAILDEINERLRER